MSDLAITIEELFLGMMEDRGLWPDEAKAVMSMVKAESGCSSVHWGDSREGYSTETLAAILMVVKDRALAWIDENNPKHFARPHFDSEDGR